MLELDLERLKSTLKQAPTEDLLDRLTAFRAGMEPEALELIEEELRARGVNKPQIQAHERKQQAEVLWLGPGQAARCCRCTRPAVAEGRHRVRLFWLVPLFTVPRYYCAEHLPPPPKRGVNPG